jgi:hypothetical protein
MGLDGPMLCDVSGLAGVNGLANPFHDHQIKLWWTCRTHLINESASQGKKAEDTP